MITDLNIKEIDLTNLSYDKNNINNIVNNTINTWQKNRGKNEKKEDTSLGKLAEAAIEFYFRNNFKNISFISYDDIRADNFEKHAPFDLLIFKNNIKEEILNNYILKITEEIRNNKYGKITDLLKKELCTNGIYIVEIKSTRTNNRHFENNILNLNKILEDDFLEYPKYLRSSENINIKNFQNYASFIKEKYNINIDNLKQMEYDNLKHLYIRIFIDEINSKAYLIGYITKNDFIKNIDLKSMKKKDKSEYALYLYSNLKNGKDINNLDKI